MSCTVSEYPTFLSRGRRLVGRHRYSCHALECCWPSPISRHVLECWWTVAFIWECNIIDATPEALPEFILDFCATGCCLIGCVLPAALGLNWLCAACCYSAELGLAFFHYFLFVVQSSPSQYIEREYAILICNGPYSHTSFFFANHPDDSFW